MKKNNQSDNTGVEILIAEDSQTQAEQLRYLLEEHGYTVMSAVNGKEALAMARQHKPALVISDVLMPHLDGYGLCKAIKSDEMLKDIPVILVTRLSESQDVMLGLECGADNFIRKPYDERYLLSRIEYLLMNLEVRKNQRMQTGVEITLGQRKYFITAERQQMLDLLISTYEQAIVINEELKARESDLRHSNEVLNALYRIADGLNQVASEQQVAEVALQRALELPGVQAGWVWLREGDSGLRLVTTQNLPPALDCTGALEGDCWCRSRFFAGELDHASNIMECERLGKAKGDTRGLRYHASVPLWCGGRTIGLMNLVGPQEGMFDEDALKVLYGVGNQVAVALERAHLHENLEQLVKEKTAALRQSETWFRAVFNSQQDAVFVTTKEGLIINANTAVEKIFGYSVAELKGRNMALLQVDEQHYREVNKHVQQSVAEDSVIHFEHQLKRKNGEIFPSEHTFSAMKSETGASEEVVRVIRDITLRKEHEARIIRLNRLYAVLSDINATIVHTHNQQELFNEACRIAVEYGQFRMVWIGLLDQENRQVMPMAKAGVGDEDGYLDQIKLTAEEGVPDACALVGRALREKTFVISNDIGADPQITARLKEEAVRRGYLSMAVIPLLYDDQVAGVFALYAAEKNFFDSEEIKLLLEVAGDISFAVDHLKKEQRIDYLAYYDDLTGLPNRTLFFDRLRQFMHAAEECNAILALLIIDVERFRFINETLGRHAGDALLKLVAERLRMVGLDAHHLSRVSSNSYAIVLDHIRKEAEVAHFIEKNIMQAMSQPFTVDQTELQITTKAGIAMFPADGIDADILFRNAEAALAKTKLSGDRYLFYTPELNARVAEKLTMENKLRRALEQEQFVLHYQPKVSLKNGQIVGVEALIRWNDPGVGLVPPMKFIPLLEETGMILEVGTWVLKKALSDILLWLESGLQPPRVAVNVSQLQLRQNDFVDIVKTALNANIRVAQYLELEITESLIMQDVELNIQKLKLIGKMGATVSVDDFGTGYSSLSYIAKLPINALKIDRAFIINMASNPNDMSIVSAIISMAHSLDLKVIAEGVETHEQANLLKLLKCDEIQGYLFSPAVTAEQFGLFLKENKSLPM